LLLEQVTRQAARQQFLSLEPTFPAAFFGFVSTFAGAGLADNLADLLLGFGREQETEQGVSGEAPRDPPPGRGAALTSSLAAPSAELTFLLGIVAAGRARAGCLRAAARREPSRSWAARCRSSRRASCST